MRHQVVRQILKSVEKWEIITVMWIYFFIPVDNLGIVTSGSATVLKRVEVRLLMREVSICINVM